MDDGGWAEYGKLVLAELQRLNAGMESLARDIHGLQKSWGVDLNNVRKECAEEDKEIRAEIATVDQKHSVNIGQLQVKAGVWGLVGGLIPVLIAVGIAVVKMG